MRFFTKAQDDKGKRERTNEKNVNQNLNTDTLFNDLM